MNETILINTITSWDEPPRARHQFAEALASFTPVIFIERNKFGWFGLSLKHPGKNISLLQPGFPLDSRIRCRLPLLNDFYQIWLYRKLHKLYPDAVVVNFDFSARRLYHYFPRNIYYCHDEYAGNGKYTLWLIDRYIRFCERSVASHSNFCVATSRYLSQKLSLINSFTYEIPLGVSLPVDESAGSCCSIERQDKIYLGLMGVINERHSSLELVNSILSDNRFYLYLIGPIEKSFRKKITSRDNITITGVLKGQELRDVLQKIDVGLALYNMRSMNPGTTPNKLWQYISLGKPVVVSDLENLKFMEFPEKSVYIAGPDQTVNDCILKAFTENTEELCAVRIAFARKNTWINRIQKFLEIFNSHFPGVFANEQR